MCDSRADISSGMLERLRATACGALVVTAAVAGCARRPAASATVSVPYVLDTLDPHARNLVGLLAVTANLYEPLVVRGAELELRPCLATRWYNPDPLTWVFHLREGVRFHDGRPLEAADVVATFDRLRSHPELELGLYTREIAAARALDVRTVELRTRRPVAVFLNQLALVPIVRRDATAADLQTAAAGTGPYTVREWQEGLLSVARFDDYWGGRPPLEDVVYRLGRDPDGALDDVRSGVSQLAQMAHASRSALDGHPELRVERRPGFSLHYLGFDVSREQTPFVPGRVNPFRDPRVRRAVALAIDRPSLVSRVGIAAAPATQLVPSVIFGFAPGLAVRATDVAAARALLADAGLADGFDVTLHVRQDGGRAGAAIADQLRAVGIRATVREVPDRTFADDPPSLFLTRWGCDTGDVSDMLEAVFHGVDRERHLGLANLGRYQDAAVDAEIEATAEMLDLEHRRRRLRDLTARLLDADILVPLYFPEEAWAVHRDLAWRPRADGYVLAAEISRRKSP
jgi:peptide/nickel transport system substrate-binding protein